MKHLHVLSSSLKNNAKAIRQRFPYIKQGGWNVFSREAGKMIGCCFDTEGVLFHYFYIMGNNLPDGHNKK